FFMEFFTSSSSHSLSSSNVLPRNSVPQIIPFSPSKPSLSLRLNFLPPSILSEHQSNDRTTRLGSRNRRPSLHRHRRRLHNRRLPNPHNQQKLPLPNAQTCQRQTNLARSSSPTHLYRRLSDAHCTFLVRLDFVSYFTL